SFPSSSQVYGDSATEPAPVLLQTPSRFTMLHISYSENYTPHDENEPVKGGVHTWAQSQVRATRSPYESGLRPAPRRPPISSPRSAPPASPSPYEPGMRRATRRPPISPPRWAPPVRP